MKTFNLLKRYRKLTIAILLAVSGVATTIYGYYDPLFKNILACKGTPNCSHSLLTKVFPQVTVDFTVQPSISLDAPTHLNKAWHKRLCSTVWYLWVPEGYLPSTADWLFLCYEALDPTSPAPCGASHVYYYLGMRTFIQSILKGAADYQSAASSMEPEWCFTCHRMYVAQHAT